MGGLEKLIKHKKL